MVTTRSCVYLFLLLTMIAVNAIRIGAGLTSAKGSFPEEKAGLEALYTSTGGDKWLNSTNWMKNDDYCTWRGVTCSGDGHVIRL